MRWICTKCDVLFTTETDKPIPKCFDCESSEHVIKYWLQNIPAYTRRPTED